MKESLDELYLKWLYRQVASVRVSDPARTFWSLLRRLNEIEFVWFIPNDDNRIEDGRDLRYEFLNERKLRPDERWLALNCSMLEMLVGLSRRFAFEADTTPAKCFWEMLDNLDLAEYSDYFFRNQFTDELVDNVIRPVIDRTYSQDGTGGLFPLKDSRDDQRKVELWYQLSMYLLERS